MDPYELISEKIDRVIVVGRRQHLKPEVIQKRMINKLAVLFAEQNKTERLHAQWGLTNH